MKKVFYKTIILISVVNLILLLLICSNLGIFSSINDIEWLPAIKSLISNDYFINIFCSILSVVGLYLIQLQYCKSKLKNDFRCNEIIHDLYNGIERTYRLVKSSKHISIEIDEAKERKDLDFWAVRKIEAEKYIDFYSRHKVEFDLCNLSLTYYNTDILIDSVQTVFFINLNFKLLSIVNNIKNCKPNLTERYSKIKQFYEEYQQENNEKSLLDLGREINHYISRMNFMAGYWYELLNYLGYDPTPIKFYIALFNAKYPSDEERINFFKLPVSKQNKISHQLQRQVLIECIKYKAKKIF